MLNKHKNGFTIVELLIVIVVLAILVSITVVSYNGISVKARNNARIATAQQAVKMILNYKSYYGSYPPSPTAAANYGVCLTIENTCTNYTATVVTQDNTSVLNELRKISSPIPKSDRTKLTPYYGLYFDVYDVRYYEGVQTSGLVMFWLEGNNQNCQVNNVMAPFPSGGGAYPTPQMLTKSTTGYTYGNDDPNITECYVSV